LILFARKLSSKKVRPLPSEAPDGHSGGGLNPVLESTDSAVAGSFGFIVWGELTLFFVVVSLCKKWLVYFKDEEFIPFWTETDNANARVLAARLNAFVVRLSKLEERFAGV
jgi:hypothetical protein